MEAAFGSTPCFQQPELQCLEDIYKLNDAMYDDPHPIIHYILSIREDPQKLDDVQKKIERICARRQEIEERKAKRQRRKEIEDEFSFKSRIGLSFMVYILAVFAIALAVVTFSNVLHGIPPWSPEFRLIRKNCLAAKWHPFLLFSFIFASFIVGAVQGYAYTKLSVADIEKDSSKLGIARRLSQVPEDLTTLMCDYLSGSEPVPRIFPPSNFASYVGSMSPFSQYSKWDQFVWAFGFLGSSFTICCMPFLNDKEDDIENGNCVGDLAKLGFLFIVLLISVGLCSVGRLKGWCFGMGRLARRLRRECLRESAGLEGCEGSGKQRLAVLIADILQDKIASKSVEVKSAEAVEYHEVRLETLIKRIRC